MCLDLANYNYVYPLEKLNISQSACVCFNSLCLMLSGVYGFPEPFIITYSWKLETSATNVEQNRSCSEWWKHGSSKEYFHLEKLNLFVSYLKTILGHSLVFTQKNSG